MGTSHTALLGKSSRVTCEPQRQYCILPLRCPEIQTLTKVHHEDGDFVLAP